MLKPPFSRLSQPVSPSSEKKDKAQLQSPASSTPAIPDTLPVAVRNGNSLARTKDDPDACFATELLTERLDVIKGYLWLAGMPGCARPLHRQLLLRRQIHITEDPNEHLVWYQSHIFIKPLPKSLFSLDCWNRTICKNLQLHEAACGLLLSYAWLVRHESDLRIAHDIGLLPKTVDWTMWTDFIDDFLEHIQLESLVGISPRFHYGELRLSRLSKIYRLTSFKWRVIIRGYMTTSTWYQDFFARNFAWTIAIFAVVSVALSAMQVVASLDKVSAAFEDTAYGFSVFSLVLTAGTCLSVLLIWAILLVYNVTSALMHDRLVMRKRQSYISAQGDPRYQNSWKTV
jgi:hypothetical protein